MRIALDAMGGDKSLKATIKGAIMAKENWPNLEIILIGHKEKIEEELMNYPNKPQFILIHADDEILMDEEPVKAVRNKRNSSLVISVKLLKEQKVDAVISAGSTGALMAAGLLIVGRIKGIDRPALAPVFPTRKNGTLVLDVGANMDAKPLNLLQYAIMGKIYAEKLLNRKDPSIGLLNVGTEETKGNELTKTVYPLLKKAELNFIGNVEARDFPYGVCDVIVTDGFSGNIVLKLTEGLANAIFDSLKEIFMSNTISKIAALMLKKGLKRFKQQMDYTEYGGAPLLGINGLIIKAHGSSDAKAIMNAIKQAKIFIENQVIDKIRTEIEKVTEDNDER